MLNQSGGLACGFSFAGKILEGGTGMWRQLHGSMLMKTGKIDEELLNLLERGRTLPAQRDRLGLQAGTSRSRPCGSIRQLPLLPAPRGCHQTWAVAEAQGIPYEGSFRGIPVWAGAGG